MTILSACRDYVPGNVARKIQYSLWPILRGRGVENFMGSNLRRGNSSRACRRSHWLECRPIRFVNSFNGCLVLDDFWRSPKHQCVLRTYMEKLEFVLYFFAFQGLNDLCSSTWVSSFEPCIESSVSLSKRWVTEHGKRILVLTPP